MKKKLLSLLLAAVLTLGLTACGSNGNSSNSTPNDQSEDAGTAQDADTPANAAAETDDTSDADPLADYAGTTIKLGIMGASDELIWDPIIDEFAEKGITIEKVFFTDYTQPNSALDSGDIDINAFQHHKYLNNEIEVFGYDIQGIGDTFIAALNLYSTSISSIDEIEDGAKIAIPNDAVNESRGLTVLQAAGLITLSEDAVNYTKDDVVENPKNIEFVEVDASQTASLLPDVSAAIINSEYALDAGLSPVNDSIFFDDPSFYKTDEFANVIAARTEDADSPLYQAIVEAYQTDRTKDIYTADFEGAYVAAW